MCYSARCDFSPLFQRSKHSPVSCCSAVSGIFTATPGSASASPTPIRQASTSRFFVLFATRNRRENASKCTQSTEQMYKKECSRICVIPGRPFSGFRYGFARGDLAEGDGRGAGTSPPTPFRPGSRHPTCPSGPFDSERVQ